VALHSAPTSSRVGPYTAPFVVCSNQRYRKLFKRYVFEQTTLSNTRKRNVIKQFRGPCYGTCMALRQFHREHPMQPLESAADAPNFLQDALAYTLSEITHRRKFPHQRTFLTSKNPEQFLRRLFSHLKSLGPCTVLLRIWSRSRLPPFPPHSMLLLLEDDQYAFHDSGLQAIMHTECFADLAVKFSEFIRTNRPRYLRSDVIWRVESGNPSV
jgi:hypothetical protein